VVRESGEVGSLDSFVDESLFDSISPQAISSGMLRRPPTNLNRQSEDATILLIREVLAKGIELSEACV